MTPAPSTRRLRYVLALAAVAVAGWWWQRGDAATTTAPGARSAEGAELDGPGLPPIRRLVDGKWVVSPRAVARSGHRDGLAHVTGRVVDRTADKGVGGVEVVFVGADGEASATSAPDGGYAIDVPPGAYRAFVRGDGVISVGLAGPERLPGPPPAASAGVPDDRLAPAIAITRDQDHVDLDVEEGGKVHGRVFDRAGHPVVGAMVRARGNLRPVLGTDVAETALDGTFDLELPVGGWSLEATHPDYAGIAVGEQDPWVTVEPAQVAAIDLTMAAGCVIRGHVRAPDGGPASDGAVEVALDEGGFSPSGQIDADGAFRWATLATGDVQVRAWPWKSPPSEPQRFTCSEGARFDAEFRIGNAAPDLDGSIATADGSPVPGAFIDVWSLTPGGMSQQERADADGNWAVYAMPPGDYLITATVDGAGQVQRRVTVPAHGVALGLGGTGALVGTAKGLDEGTVMVLIGGCDTDGAGVPSMAGPASRLAPVHGGRFRVDGLPACKLELAVRAGAQSEVQEVDITKDHDTAATFDLTPPHEIAVHGVVRRPDGVAAAGAHVAGVGEDAHDVVAGADGSFTLRVMTGSLISASIGDTAGTVEVPRDARDGATFDIALEQLMVEDLEVEEGFGQAAAADPAGPDVGYE